MIIFNFVRNCNIQRKPWNGIARPTQNQKLLASSARNLLTCSRERSDLIQLRTPFSWDKRVLPCLNCHVLSSLCYPTFFRVFYVDHITYQSKTMAQNYKSRLVSECFYSCLLKHFTNFKENLSAMCMYIYKSQKVEEIV